MGTARESAQVLKRLLHPRVQLIWGPANAFIPGETPYPDGYRLLPRERVLQVHVKDCVLRDGRPVWGPPGEMGVAWVDQTKALTQDGYDGWLSLETHWTGPSRDKLEASVICGRRLRELVADSAAPQ